jgi:xylulokinase
MSALLGLDLGTGSFKALVVSVSGEVLGRGEAGYPIQRPEPLAAEQDPAEWRSAARSAVRQAVGAAGSPDIAAIGLSGQMHGTVPIDAEGNLVRPAIIWADRRSVDEARAIRDEVGAERLAVIAGSPVVAGFQAATCRWLAEHEPEHWARTATVLAPKDEIRRWLTGEIATEPSDASATLLFDIQSKDWSPKLLAAAGIERARLPRVLSSTAISGALTASAADDLGLPAGIPVSGGVADAPGAALGAGVTKPSTLLLTISTGAQALIPANMPLIDLRGRIHSFCGPLDSPAWYAMGATMAAGLALRWLRDQVFELRVPDAYDLMNQAAAEVSPGAGGLIYAPYLIGERTPLMDPDARGVFLGLTARHGRGHLVRAVMEGVAFSLFEAFAMLRDLGAAPEQIVLAGGGARSAVWRQIMADVFEMPVFPALEPDQSAMGAAITAGAAIGWFDPVEASRQWARLGSPIEPMEGNTAVYRELLPIFRGVYPAHRTDFKTLRQIESR